MKKLKTNNPFGHASLVMLLVLLFSCGGSNFTPIPIPKTHLGNLTIDTPEAMLQFFQDNITVVGGDLTIGSAGSSTNSTITDLELMSKLKRVSGRLQIMGTQLTSLEGLDSLEHAGQLIINRNDFLQDLNHLGQLETEQMLITSNQRINSLAGLNSMQSEMELLMINDNPALGNLIGLEFLEQVGRLVLVDNSTLQSVEGLNSLWMVSEDIEISRNEALNNLEAFSTLSGIGGTLRISGNDQLSSLTGFENLTFKNDLIIEDNANLQNLDGLMGLSRSGSTFRILNNPRLTDFCGLSNLVNSTDFGGILATSDNGFNPGVEDIRGGDCKEE